MLDFPLDFKENVNRSTLLLANWFFKEHTTFSITNCISLASQSAKKYKSLEGVAAMCAFMKPANCDILGIALYHQMEVCNIFHYRGCKLNCLFIQAVVFCHFIFPLQSERKNCARLIKLFFKKNQHTIHLSHSV